MSPDDPRWRGEWIWLADDTGPQPPSRFGGPPPPDTEDVTVLFRREFVLDQVPPAARIRLTSNSRHILYVNGREVTRGPIRSNARHIFFDTVDVTEHLVEGINCIAVLVRYYGYATAWWAPAPLTGPGSEGGLVLEMETRAGDTGPDEVARVVLASDSSWRVTRAGCWEPLRPSDVISAQIPEVFDARNFDPQWTAAGFDDSDWTLARPSTTPQFGRRASSRPPAEPFGRPLPNPLPHPETRTRLPHSRCPIPLATNASEASVALREVLEAAPDVGSFATDSDERRVEGLEKGSALIVDFGGIVSGIVSFRLTADSGARVVVSLIENLDPSALASANRIEYIARGDLDSYESLEFMGGRFAVVAVLDGSAVFVEEVRVTEHARPRPEGTGFHCDDEALNRLHSVCLRTVDLCARDAYMDCPTREQRAWAGDAVIHQWVDLTTNSNWSLAIRNTQLHAAPRPDGLLPMVAAADFSDPATVAIPDASLHWTRTVHNLYRYTGDKELVATLMSAFEAVLRWFLPFQGEDGLLREVTGWVLIDWAPTEVDGAVASLNGLWARALTDFAEISDWLGDRGRAKWARETHARVKEGFERFWDPERELYVDSIVDDVRSRRLSEHAHAAAITGGLVPENRFPRIAEVLLDRDHVVDPTLLLDCSPSTFFQQTLALRHAPNWDVERDLVAAQPFFRYVVHDALAILGRADSLPGLLRDWDALLEIGPSALREVWRGQSYAHAWSATPARDLVLHVAGISPAEPGFEVVKIAPRLGRLRSLAISAPTPHGLVRLQVQDGNLVVDSPRPVLLVRPDGAVTEHPAGQTRAPWPLDIPG